MNFWSSGWRPASFYPKTARHQSSSKTFFGQRKGSVLQNAFRAIFFVRKHKRFPTKVKGELYHEEVACYNFIRYQKKLSAQHEMEKGGMVVQALLRRWIPGWETNHTTKIFGGKEGTKARQESYPKGKISRAAEISSKCTTETPGMEVRWSGFLRAWSGFYCSNIFFPSYLFIFPHRNSFPWARNQGSGKEFPRKERIPLQDVLQLTKTTQFFVKERWRKKTILLPPCHLTVKEIFKQASSLAVWIVSKVKRGLLYSCRKIGSRNDQRCETVSFSFIAVVANPRAPFNCVLGIGVYGKGLHEGCAMAYQSALVYGDGSLKLGFRSTQISEDAIRVASTAVRIRASVLKWHLGLDHDMQRLHPSVPTGTYRPWLYRQDDKDLSMNITPATVISDGASSMYLFFISRTMTYLYRCGVGRLVSTSARQHVDNLG